MPTFSDILVSKDIDETRTCIVTINRPSALNALRMQTLLELQTALVNFASDKSSMALVLTGSGDRAFSAGGDIRAMEKMNYSEAKKFADRAHLVISKIIGCKKPVLAAVNGVAFGAGFDLALSCDICVATKSAKFGYPSLKLGVISPFSGTRLLPRLIGYQRARDLLLTGRTLDVSEALSWGLVSSIAETQDDLLKISKDIVRRMLDVSPNALMLEKKLLNKEILQDLKKSNNLEAECYAQCFKSPDRKEGIAAFLEKRKPVFSA